MKWMRFRVRTNTASEDIIISAMEDIGLYGAQIEDKVPLSGRELEELFIDEAPLQAISDDNGEADLACLNFYVEIAEDEENFSPDAMVEQMRGVLDELRAWSDIGDGTITVSVTEDIDWRDNWKQYFHKFFIDDVLVLPSWEQVTDAERESAAHILHIDPGAAFGTGLHETTRLAVRAIRRVLDDADKRAGQVSVLDVGCGSGVLSVLALMFGARSAVGIDVDPLAVSASEENRDQNGFGPAQMTVYRGDLIGDSAFREKILKLGASPAAGGGSASSAGGTYDLIVANILPNVLVPLAPVLPELLAADGTIVYSGILKTKAPEVEEALTAAGFAVTARDDLGEWCSLTAVRAAV